MSDLKARLGRFGGYIDGLRELASVSMEADAKIVPAALPMKARTAHFVESLKEEWDDLEEDLQEALRAAEKNGGGA